MRLVGFCWSLCPAHAIITCLVGIKVNFLDNKVPLVTIDYSGDLFVLYRSYLCVLITEFFPSVSLVARLNAIYTVFLLFKAGVKPHENRLWVKRIFRPQRQLDTPDPIGFFQQISLAKVKSHIRTRFDWCVLVSNLTYANGMIWRFSPTHPPARSLILSSMAGCKETLTNRTHPKSLQICEFAPFLLELKRSFSNFLCVCLCKFATDRQAYCLVAGNFL